MTDIITRADGDWPSGSLAATTVVEIPRALRRLDLARSTPVVLVCAPAGYGKSLSVASWADRRSAEVAWVSLGGIETDAGAVWTAVVQALGAARPGRRAGLEPLARLAARASSEVPARLARWVRQQDAPVFLVLDDLHTVTSVELHEQLLEFVAAAAFRLRLIVLTRHDPPWPLHRMRLDGLLMDLRSDVLAFDAEQAATLFGSLGVELCAEQVADLVDRTEGWVAGLRLAAMGAATDLDPQRYIRELSGRTGYIADYLMREVYERQSPQWQDLLTKICVVDEICPELAEALGADADSAHPLAELVRQNTFIASARDRPGWYRLHPLLLDFLRSRATDAAERRSLHRRAAAWFQRQGEPKHALRHALHAEDWDLAGDVVSEHVVTWTVRERPQRVLDLLASVPREEILMHIGLALGVAAAHSMQGNAAALPELVDAARSQLATLAPGQLRSRHELVLRLIDLGGLRWSGNVAALLSCCQSIDTDPTELASLGLADWLALRTMVVNNLGVSELWLGAFDDALLHLTEAAREDDRPVVLPTLNAQAHLAYLRWVRGELNQADELARHAISGFTDLGEPLAVQARCAYLAHAGIALDRGDPATARRWLDVVQQASAEPHTEFVAHLLQIQVQAAEGSLFDALSAVRRLRRQVASSLFSDSLEDSAAQLEAQLLGRAGNAAAARTVLALVSSPAERLTPSGCVRDQVVTNLSTAHRELVAGERALALEALEVALVAAGPERLRQPFLAHAAVMRQLLSMRIELGTGDPEFAVDLLQQASDQVRSSSPAGGLLVPLTERETNLLRYLATTLTTREIADKLYVSVNTVKTHQRAIHQKLGASDRRTAVTHARELGLL